MSEFETFSASHLVAATASVSLAVAIPLLLRTRVSASTALTLGRALALALLGHEAARLVLRTVVLDQPLFEHLPLQLCGVALILGSVMLWRRSFGLFEVVYFWGIGGSLAALLTPDLEQGFPHPIFVTFFVGHGLVLSAVFYATFVYRFRPRLRSVGIALGILALYASVIFPLNLALGTNYLYLARKPARASPLDWLGPWPYYIAGLSLLVVVICLLAWLPFARPRPSGEQST